MKKIYELSISSNYVHTWGIEEAIREIMQNAIDSETDGNLLSVEYNDGTLKIQNRGCTLDISTLVLGNSGKEDPSKYIGTYGEGFKLALIVLVRNGLVVNIRTNNQVWTAEFRKSRKFKVETLHIDVNDEHGFGNSISFEISGIDYETFTSIRNKNLAMMRAMNFDIGEVIETDYGRILLNKKFKGMMFVKGLFVQTDSSFEYGYDFKPEYLHLDRDRKAINYYKMRELTSKAITSQKDAKLVSTAISKSYTDIKDVVNFLDDITQEYKVNFANYFLTEHNLDEDTFVGLKNEVAVAKKPKSFVTDSVAIASLVNEGIGRKEEYSMIKRLASNKTSLETAMYNYDSSDWEKVIDFLYKNKDFLPISETVELIENVTDLHTSYFHLIQDSIIDKFLGIEEEIDEDEDDEE